MEKDYEWSDDVRIFKEWTEGRTVEPFVNANMIELNSTGWMSNRGRQNVASFLKAFLLPTCYQQVPK